MLFKTAPPAEYANAFLLTEKSRFPPSRIKIMQNVAVIIFDSIKKSALSTQYSRYD